MATNPEPTKLTSTPSSPLATAGLAIALYIAVIDAAVETFLSGSPVRWWVVGVVAGYFAVGVGLWRYRRSAWQNMGWSARASASFFLLLGLLAFTVWLPGGLTDGIRVVGQSTSRVLSLFTSVVIVLAGVSLVRLSWLPRWAKVVAGLLSAYGLAAFVKGIVIGAEFAALLHGDSLWTRLPAWLQGAFLGALVVVPAGLLLHAAHMLRTIPGTSRAWDLRQGIAMAMSVLMAISAFTGTGALGPKPSAAEIVQPVGKSYQELGEALAGPKPKTPLTPDQVADRLDKLFPMLEKAERQIPRDTFDLQVVIDRVGKDPQKLFEWVRDHTYFVPYRGLLRGDKGVLMDRLGNSLDRSMLLYAMLRSIGQPVRLARGTLTEAQAQDVLKKVQPFPSVEERTGSASSSAATDAFVKQYADQNEVDAAKIRRALDQLTAQQKRVKELVQKRVEAQAAMIGAAVGRPPAGAAAAERADQVRAVTDHWWVQWQNGGRWVELDPTLPDAQPGKTLTAAQTTTAPASFNDLGDDLLHTVQIKVVIEVWKHGHVSEVPVLTQVLVPAGLIGESIVLQQVPVGWPQDLNLLQEKDPLERLKQTVLAQTEWLPVLSVGSQNVSRYSFNDYGDLTDSLMPGYVQNVMAGRVLAHKEEEGVGGLGKSIGGLLSGPRGQQQLPDQKPAAEPERTQVTAEWINYEVRIPGKPVRTIRREMFDLVGPAARSAKKVPLPQMTDAQRLERGLKLLGETEILPLVSYLPSEFVLHLAVKDALANREALLGLFRIADSSDLKASVGLASKFTQFPVQLLRLAALARKKWSRFSDDVYLDRPNILSYYSRFGLNAKGQVLVREGYDIVANEVAVRSTRGTDAFFVRLEQGLLDTNAEAILAAARCGSLGKEPICRQIENTSELFNVSRKRGTDWLLLENVRDPAWEHMELPTDVRTRVEQDLAAGYTVLVPKQMVRIESDSFVGWWRLNARSGDILGIGEAGGGQTATEYILKNIVAFLPAIVMLIVAKRCAQIHCPCFVIGGIAMAVMLFGWLCVGAEFVEGVVLGAWGDIGFGLYDFIKAIGECVDSWTEAGLKVGS
jgi:hypothetical protein